MAFGMLLFDLMLEPIMLLFEAIYHSAVWITGDRVSALILVSIALNIMLLPLYHRADAVREENLIRYLDSHTAHDLRFRLSGNESATHSGPGICHRAD